MPNFTMYLKDILDKTFEGNTVNDLLVVELGDFPTFAVEGGNSQTFLELFKRRNLYQEIGFETVQGWCANFRRVADQARILYADKVRLQLTNMNQLLSRVIEEEDTHTSTSYLNPANAAAQPQVEAMRVNAASKTEYKNQRIAGLFKSNPEVMEEMAKMTVLYDEMLTFFDRCFMGVI